MTSPILSLRGIQKSFGPVQVLKDVDFDAYPVQVTALVDDNGTGKSTLILDIVQNMVLGREMIYRGTLSEEAMDWQ